MSERPESRAVRLAVQERANNFHSRPDCSNSNQILASVLLLRLVLLGLGGACAAAL